MNVYNLGVFALICIANGLADLAWICFATFKGRDIEPYWFSFAFLWFVYPAWLVLQ